MTRKCFHVELPGGLGNQLFALFASRYISQVTGKVNHLDFTGIDYSHTAGQFDIRSFILEPHETDSCHYSTKALNRAIVNLMKRAGRFNHFKHELLGVKRFPLGNDTQSSVERFLVDQSLQCLPMRNRLFFDTYFADFGFVDAIDARIKKGLILRTSSKRFLRIANEIKSERTLALHMRMGDFMLNRNSIGVLSDTFFLKSASLLRRKKNYSRVMIFTDSPFAVKKRLNNLTFDIPVEVVESDSNVDPAEDLTLLTLCDGLVCSNSTFSLWAAKLSQLSGYAQDVVIPQTFRRDDKTRIHSLSKDWMTVESVWM